MGPLAIWLLALGLAMDATAVAAARGLAVPRVLPRHVLLVAGLFGGFQAAMPLLGYFAGRTLGAFVERAQAFVAFALLVAIGAKMLWEARLPRDEAASAGDPFAPGVMIALAFATSIDAFAAGVTLPMLGAPLLVSLTTIGATTAVSSALGLFAGRWLGAALGRRLDVLGGLVLVGLGVRVLVARLAG